MSAPTPDNENERLIWLRQTRLLDTPAEDAYDDLTRLAAQVCGVPIAAISLIDEERQWFKSLVGLPRTETPREHAFCAHAILQADVMVVPDATLDDRFKDNPLVTGQPDIRFYAGAPLVTSGGLAFGALCVIDRVPRQLTPEQRAMLEVLARQVAGRIEMQRQLAVQDELMAEQERAQEAVRQSEEELRAVVEQAMDGVFLFDPQTKRLLKTNQALRRMLGYSEEQAVALTLYDIVAHPRPSVDRNVAALARTGEVQLGERQYLHRDRSLVVVEASGRVVRHGRGEAFCVVVHDLTERRREEDARRAAEEGYHTLFKSAAEGIFQTSPDGRYLRANPALARIYGYDTPEHLLAGLTDIGGQLYVEVDRRAEFQRLMRERGEVSGFESRVRRRDGAVVWISESARPVYDAAGGLLRYEGFVEEITERKAMEAERERAAAALRESEMHLRLALESGGLGSYLLDMTTGEFLILSDTYRAQFAVPPDVQVSRVELLAVLHPDDRGHVQAAFLQGAQGGGDYEAEYRVLWPDGSVHWISARGRLIGGDGREASRMVGVTQEITERKRREMQQERALREAQEQADRDPLTGLHNHRAFHRKLEEEEARVQREGVPLAVAMLDLNNFSFFNNAYGHIIGDSVLRMVAERLLSVCRPYDTVARFGGDEFALLLPGVGEAEASGVETRLRADLFGLSFQPVGLGAAIPITVSLGVALLTDAGTDRQEVLHRADERLLRSKTGGAAETEADDIRAAANAVSGYSMLDALVTAVDNKDRYTRRHSEDVMAYSLMIAREMGMDEAALHTVAVAALLHDVGKIGVPDAILRKPDKLTEEEFAAVRQHPMMGAALVSTVPGLEGMLDAVRHHHEQWDGRGYPAGLRGEECPPIARLMAVADAFSAMTTDRPYRQGMDREKALAILKKGAGRQWDPDCVKAFLKARSRHEKVLVASAGCPPAPA